MDKKWLLEYGEDFDYLYNLPDGAYYTDNHTIYYLIKCDGMRLIMYYYRQHYPSKDILGITVIPNTGTIHTYYSTVYMRDNTSQDTKNLKISRIFKMHGSVIREHVKKLKTAKLYEGLITIQPAIDDGSKHTHNMVKRWSSHIVYNGDPVYVPYVATGSRTKAAIRKPACLDSADE